MREDNFYTVSDKKREEFYKVPKDLFILKKYANLSNEARLLYGILKDRLAISIKNNWVDEDGFIYFNYSRQSIADLLMVSLNTAKARFKELRDVNLLLEKGGKKGESLKLYLLKIDSNSDEIDIKIIHEGESKIDGGQNLTGSKFVLRGGQNLGPSKTNRVRLNIYSHFNSKNVIVHRQLNKNIINAINKALKIYSEEEIVKAIDNYAEVFHSDFYYEHKWSLDKFLKQDNGISRFTDEGDIWNSYKSKFNITPKDIECSAQEVKTDKTKAAVLTFEEEM